MASLISYSGPQMRMNCRLLYQKAGLCLLMLRTRLDSPPLCVVAQFDIELAGMLTRAATYIRLEWNLRPYSSVRLAPMPLFLEVQKLTESWKAPFTPRSCFASSSTLTTLDSAGSQGVHRGSIGRECGCGAFMPTKFRHLVESSQTPLWGM